jgi:ATP/ADP translocase
MPNTMALIGGTLPSWLGWLTALSGLPLILLICGLLGFIAVFMKRRKP